MSDENIEMPKPGFLKKAATFVESVASTAPKKGRPPKAKVTTADAVQ